MSVQDKIAMNRNQKALVDSVLVLLDCVEESATLPPEVESTLFRVLRAHPNSMLRLLKSERAAVPWKLGWRRGGNEQWNRMGMGGLVGFWLAEVRGSFIDEDGVTTYTWQVNKTHPVFSPNLADRVFNAPGWWGTCSNLADAHNAADEKLKSLGVILDKESE